jgi:hypothetical protein
MVTSHRDLVDQTYHVALNIQFQSKQAQDEYQDHPQHVEFSSRAEQQRRGVGPQSITNSRCYRNPGTSLFLWQARLSGILGFWTWLPGRLCASRPGRTDGRRYYHKNARRRSSRSDGVASLYRPLRLARGLSLVVNALDPDIFVMGGGMSNLDELYTDLAPELGCYTFSTVFETPIRKAMHGDSSGVRGAAWLWKE